MTSVAIIQTFFVPQERVVSFHILLQCKFGLERQDAWAVNNVKESQLRDESFWAKGEQGDSNQSGEGWWRLGMAEGDFGILTFF